MPYLDQVLQPGSLTKVGGNWQLSVGLPWFRSVPLANVRLEVLVNGVPLPAQGMRVLTQSGDIPFQEYFTEADGEWFLQNRLNLAIPLGEKVNGLTTVTVQGSLTTPNLMTAPNEPIVVPIRVSRDYRIN